MILKLLFLLLFNFGHFVHDTGAQTNKIHVPGNLTIVAYFSVHRRFNETGGCGDIQEVAGLQRVEVALQTIEEINTRSNRNYSIGIIIKDTCEHDFSVFPENYHENIMGTIIVGVIGPGTSEETLNFRNQWLNGPSIFGNAFHIGYAATSTNLTKGYQEGYKNFTRVVPSDEHQVQVIIRIIKEISSSTEDLIGVNIIGSPTDYGQGGINEFKKVAKTNGVCINKEKIVSYKSALEDYKEILDNTINITQIIVCFCDGDSLRDLLQTAKNMSASHKFILIASDGWSERDDVLKDVENEAEGNFFINIKSDKYNITFDHKYTSLLNKGLEAGILWIDELQKKYNCSSSSSDTLTKQRLCAETQNFQNHYKDTKLPFVKQSIEKIIDHLDNSYNRVEGYNPPYENR